MSLVRRPSPAAGLLAAVAGGTALGLLVAHPWILAGAAAAGALGAAVWARRYLVWVLAAAFGIGHGVGARREDAASCRSRLPPGPVRLTVILEEPTIARAVIAATPQGQRCHGSIALRWRDPGTALA